MDELFSQYIIEFYSKGNIFIYDVTFEAGKRIIDIRRKIKIKNIKKQLNY